MDKAKKMAEQAQQKIEETQKQFNESQAQKAGGQGAPGGGVRYDEHGRPIPGTPPASDPATAEGVSVPQPPEGLDAPEAEADGPAAAEGGAEEAAETPVPPPAAPKEGMNATPDPFKPID